MPDQRVYTASQLDLQHLSQALSGWFRARGYETQILNTPGGLTVQGRQTKEFLQRGVALNVILSQQGDTLRAQVGTGKWVLHAVEGVVAIVLFWPLLAIPAYAAYKQKAIIDDAWQFIAQYVASGGQAAVPGTLHGSATGPAPASVGSEMPCPACGEPVREDAQFCGSCGAKLTLACPACGAGLRLGAKFCNNCGEAMTDAVS